MKKERKPWERNLNQNRSYQKRKESFCIFTEGKTEELYFEEFNLPTLRVKCVGLGGGNAEHLLDEMLVYMKMAKYADYDHYWLIFDCDDNSQEELQRVVARAKKAKINWCLSNPCFELWYLLHFLYRESPMTAFDLKKHLLKEWIPGYNETMEGIYDLLKDRMDNAIRNAARLLPPEKREEWMNRLRQSNPSTNVDNLIRKLRTEK